jgi:hypothetical protein
MMVGPYHPDFTPGATVLTQLHCHTNMGDGSYTPAQVVGFYQSAGYGALAITDHNMNTDQPNGIATEIPGNEHGAGTMQHIIGLNASAYIRCGDTNTQNILNGIRASGGEAHIAHPNWYVSKISAPALAALTDYLGIEIHNGKVMGGISTNPVSDPGFAVAKWDQVLATKPDTWGIAVDDLHGIDALHTYDIGRVHVFVPANTLEDIMAALVSGNFVADVANHGVTPYYPIRTETGVTLACPGAVQMEAWAADGRRALVAGNEITYEYASDEQYVRLVAVGDYSEPFSGPLPHHWRASDGAWSVANGVLSLVGSSGADHMFLRRHREGDFQTQADVKLGGGAAVNLMFNVLNGSYWYGLRIGTSANALYNNRLAAYSTTNNGGTLSFVGSAPFAAAMDTWYTMKLDYAAATGTIRAKVWERDTAEPDWMFTASSMTWTWGGFGFRASYQLDVDNFYVSGFRTYYQPIPVG